MTKGCSVNLNNILKLRHYGYKFDIVWEGVCIGAFFTSYLFLEKDNIEQAENGEVPHIKLIYNFN